jgi:four helix bundle protein
MSNKIPTKKRKNFDLLERTAMFGEDTIEFIQSLPRNEINKPLTSQIIRSSTSIGANYMEADGAVSKKDFENKIGISRKEAKESMHWFRMIAKANPKYNQNCRKLWKEAQELVWILSAIINNSKNK